MRMSAFATKKPHILHCHDSTGKLEDKMETFTSTWDWHGRGLGLDVQVWGLWFLGGVWECLLHYRQNHMQKHNYNYLWAGIFVSAAHIPGKKGKWAPDFENGQSHISLCAMTRWSTDFFCILRKPVAVGVHWKEEIRKDPPKIMLIGASLKYCSDFTWTEVICKHHVKKWSS